ncbi:hypothetical protein [Roseomonas sp. WA12]
MSAVPSTTNIEKLEVYAGEVYKFPTAEARVLAKGCEYPSVEKRGFRYYLLILPALFAVYIFWIDGTANIYVSSIVWLVLSVISYWMGAFVAELVSSFVSRDVVKQVERNFAKMNQLLDDYFDRVPAIAKSRFGYPASAAILLSDATIVMISKDQAYVPTRLSGSGIISAKVHREVRSSSSSISTVTSSATFRSSADGYGLKNGGTHSATVHNSAHSSTWEHFSVHVAYRDTNNEAVKIFVLPLGRAADAEQWVMNINRIKGQRPNELVEHSA